MCRILLVRSDNPFDIQNELQPFASLSQNSREYQGHGWGCSWLDADTGEWRHYHNIKPVWEDDTSQFTNTRLLLVHARSAFRDEGIAVENNMPFTDGESVFIFNGELRGVKIKSEGRIGAEKIYNYIRRMDRGDKLAALQKAVSIINRRTTYVRAMNIIMADKNTQLVSSTFGEDPGYFQMRRSTQEGILRICSEAFAGESHWQPIDNHTTFAV
jgi:glutamine amidotransferase